jgi:glycosyltransferase involved in cell wall biosynthesis
MSFFSVIIPTYNREKFILPAIESVLNQMFTDFELIIIDDASTDNTEQIVTSIADSRIVYVKNSINLERCTSRNIGIQRAVGQYICFLDSDDLYMPNHLEVLHSNIIEQKSPCALFLINAFDMVDNVLYERDCPEIKNYNTYDFIVTYTFNPPRMCIHKDILQKHLFDPLINICEDVDISLRIAREYPIIQINERTVVYNLHPGTFTLGDPLKPFKQIDSFTKIFARKELKGLIPRKSKNRLFSMANYHAAIYYEKEQKYWNMYTSIFRSFFLYPKGYNGNTNKVMLVMFIYHLPIVGKIIQFLKKK